jgi:hypothetical protein
MQLTWPTCLIPTTHRAAPYREVNSGRVHTIPIGSLVELESGARLFVVHHGRDCDQTPLYYLSSYKEDVAVKRQGFRNPTWIGGYSESSLREVV